MKKYQVLFVVAIALVLSACGGNKEEPASQGSVDEGQAENEYGSLDHGVNEQGVGFNVTGESIEEAQNVPAAEKEQILEAFDAYINMFNEKDIDRFIDMLSVRWDKEAEREEMTNNFSEYDVHHEVSDVTIVKYSEDEAQVFSKVQASMKQLSSGLETKSNGRQVTVFTKEEVEWKVESIHVVPDYQKQ